MLSNDIPLSKPTETQVRPAYNQRHPIEQRLPNDGNVRMNELFWSIQGEGPDLGLPACFVRLALCNRKCVWCDTDYSLKALVANKTLVEALLERYSELPGRAFIIWTGGEPTLQSEALCDIMQRLRAHASIDWYFTCESNAVLLDDVSTLFYRALDRIVLSPKPPSSKNPEYDWERLWRFLEPAVLNRKTCVKPVIMDDVDMRWMLQAAEMPSRPRNVEIVIQTWVDPDGDGMAEFREYWRKVLTQEFIERMRQLNIRLMPRMHNLIWGNFQGV